MRMFKEAAALAQPSSKTSLSEAFMGVFGLVLGTVVFQKFFLHAQVVMSRPLRSGSRQLGVTELSVRNSEIVS